MTYKNSNFASWGSEDRRWFSRNNFYQVFDYTVFDLDNDGISDQLDTDIDGDGIACEDLPRENNFKIWDSSR